MTKRFLILLVLFGSLALRCYPQEINLNDRLRKIVTQNGQAEVTIPFNGKISTEFLTRNVSILNVKNKQVYISLSPLTVDWFILQKFDYQIIEREDSKGAISAMNMTQAMGWDKYPTYPQYDSIMQSFKTLYPTLCHLDTIGTSINGKLVFALKISDNAAVKEDKPEVFYTSTIHGDETGGFILMLHLADYLLKNYNLDSRVKNMVDNLEIWINPLSNPDGAYRVGNIISDLTSTRYNAKGVDLNRNFPDPLQPGVIQQKENVDMIKFLRKHKFVISANFHAGAEVVNYPWDRWPRLHADDDWFYNISRAYADTVHAHSVVGYMIDEMNGVTNGYAWYQVLGGRQDFMTYSLQGREVTIELDNNYVTPAANLNTLWQSNYRSLLGYLENAMYGIHGHVSNSISHEPVSAIVFITDHDKDSSQVISDIKTGSFVRMLTPGIWNLTFSAQGYYDKIVSNVVVISGQKTDLTVDLVPIINEVDTTNPEAPFLYPNPAAEELKAVLPQDIIGAVNIKVFNQTGMLMLEYNTEALSKIPLLVDIRSLSRGIYYIVFTNNQTKITYRSRFVVIK
jgi:Zinc carboxypeptidase/Secretion system C-terminal sorting domain